MAVDGVQLTFTTVTGAGTTTVDVITPCTPNIAPDTGFSIWGSGSQSTCYDINTTATFSGVIQVCITYDDSGLNTQQENALILKHAKAGNGPPWNDPANQTVDKAANVVCGDTDSLSTFTLQLPLSVGGIALDPDLGALPPEAADSSNGGAAVLAGVIGAAAAAAALGGAGWYAKRRRARR